MITPMAFYRRKDWDESPPFFQRAQLRLGLTIVAPLIAGPMIGLIASLTPGMGMRAYTRLFAAWMVAGFITLFVIAIVRHRKLRSRWNAAHRRLCVHCAYNLRSLGEHGICPECGKPFHAQRDAISWSRAGYCAPPVEEAVRIDRDEPRLGG